MGGLPRVTAVMAPSNAALIGSLVVLIVGAALVRLDAPFEPVVWKNATKLPKMKGALSPNERLLAVEHLHEGDVIAPEALAEGDDGVLYTGLWDGRVVALDENGENPRDIFFTGGVVSSVGKGLGSTTGVDYGTRLMSTCRDKARNKELTVEDEKKCGRPLDVRWHAGKLYILDAYHGLFELDVKAGRAKHLIDASTDVPKPLGTGSGTISDSVTPAAETTLPLTFLNALVFAPDGSILLTDSSWKHPRALNRHEIIDGAPRGRLVRFDPETGDLRTVMCGLHFPNGIEVDPSGTKLLIVESLRFRILEVDIKAVSSEIGKHPSFEKALGFCGENEALPEGVRVFAAALPGFADNLVFDEEFGGYVVGIGTKVSSPFSPLHLSLQAPEMIRNLIGKLVPMSAIEKTTPRYGLVIVVNLDGTVKESIHDPTGRTPFISHAHRHSKSGYTFLGSSQNPYLGRIRL